MGRRRPLPRPDPLARVITVGELERLAGLEQTTCARTAFWRQFASQSHEETLKAGVAVLRRMVNQRLARGEISLLPAAR